MPEYEYFCRQCRQPFSSMMSVKEHDERLPECPRCHHTEDVEKRLAHFNTVTTRKSATW